MRIAIFLLGLIGAVCHAAEPTPQSPAKPSLTGLKLIDQKIHDPKLSGYITPEGFKLEIVAEEPTVINPVAMTFGIDGSLYVIEWSADRLPAKETTLTTTYRDGTTRDFVVMKKETKDRIKKLTYDPKSGRFTNPVVILEEELPSSLMIHDGWLYTTARGSVRRWKLKDIEQGNQPAAKPEIIAKGFSGYHHHQVSGLVIGPDGWLYISSGDDDNVVEGSDGSRVTILRTGGIFRCRPDGSKMELFSHGYRNPYGPVAFDRRFNAFHVDNDNNDGSKFTGCRLMHVAEGSDFGWRLAAGARCCQADMVRGADAGESPGKMPLMLKTGRGAPAGLLIDLDGGFPEYFREQLYYPDVMRQSIRAYRIQPRLSTFEVTHEYELLKSADRLFRPCQMVNGPDGAIYIVDWRTESNGGGRLGGDGIHGRIYRLTWNGGTLPESGEDLPAIARRSLDSWLQIVRKNDAELVQALKSPVYSDRQLAQQELIHRGDKNLPAILALFANAETPSESRSLALGCLEVFWSPPCRDAVVAIFDETDLELKRVAIDVLGRVVTKTDQEVITLFIRMLSDHDRAIRRAAALALGRIKPSGIAEQIVINLKTDPGTDPFLIDGYIRALERLGKPGIHALLDLARSGNQRDLDHSINAFLAGRTREMVDALPELLTDPHVSAEQRAALIRSVLNYQLNPAIKLDSLMVAFNKLDQPSAAEYREMVLVLAENQQLVGDVAIKIAERALQSDSADTRLGAIQAISQAKASELATNLLNAIDRQDRDASERIAMLKALRNLNKPGLTDGIVNLLKANPPANLRIEALRTLASLEPATAATWAMESLDAADISVQRAAIEILGQTSTGARLVGERYLAKKLPRELLPSISDALRKHTSNNPAMATMLTSVMKGGLLVTNQQAEVEKVRQLVLTKGDATKGRAIYLNSSTLACVTCHKLEGVGGQIGPDLTRIWDTTSIEKIIESMVEPSKEIKEGYRSYRLTTNDGRTLTGLKIAETPAEITIREANGADVRIKRTNVAELAVSNVSLMPDNVISQLSFDQFIDLVAFLKNRRAQESLRGIVLQYQAEIDGKTTLLTTQPNGVVQIPFSATSPTRLNFTVNVEKDQTVPMIIGVDGSISVQINDAAPSRYPAGTGFQLENIQTKLVLKTGTNTVRLTLTPRTTGDRLFVRLQASDLQIMTVPKK